MIFYYPGTFVVRGIRGNVFLFSAYRVQHTKLNKNNFCVSQSRCHSGFGPPRGFGPPGPDPLADLDPPVQIR